MKGYRNISLFSIATLAISILMVVSNQKPSYASFTICNKTNSKIQVAIAYDKKAFSYVESGHTPKVGTTNFQVTGWFSFYPGECKNTLSKNLEPLRKIYYYANSSYTKNFWGGNKMFCVSGNAFQYRLGYFNHLTCEENFRNPQDRERRRLYNIGFKELKLSGNKNVRLNLGF